MSELKHSVDPERGIVMVTQGKARDSFSQAGLSRLLERFDGVVTSVALASGVSLSREQVEILLSSLWQSSHVNSWADPI